MPQKLVIIGAGFGGVWSALSAKRLLGLANKQNEIEVVVVAPKPTLVMRPRLYESNASSLVHHLDVLFEEAGIKFISGIAHAIHTEEHTVDIKSASGLETTVNYDRLIIAAGSSVNRPQAIKGIQEHSFDVDSLEGAVKLEAHLEGLGAQGASPGRDTVVVCGAGFTGIEIAAELPRRLAHIPNARVILVGNANEVGPDFGTEPRPAIASALADLGVEFKLGSGVAAVDSDGITLANGERLETKTAIWTAGVKATPLTAQIPGQKDAMARLYVDQHLRVSSADGVFATGDAACAIADGKSQYALMCCQHAIQLGRVSGHNAAAALLGEPLIDYSQAAYNCCLDLGAWGALVASGWDRETIKLSGDTAKRVKCYINQKLIYPPDNAQEALDSADPVGFDSDQLFEQLTQIAG
ncbi:unnamed protein product [Penicillium olsonii]|uniref:FAD/NAD(P)-binding domain-containing protein n=1 Tax=Penicillium olsonii TaxID=99116 RepID=A0A9W4I4C7_PENOL|nr:unnamed protein product [Penicillium olsonii]CAG8281286.1 unnamed protein product [Penicillium olsonii]